MSKKELTTALDNFKESAFALYGEMMKSDNGGIDFCEEYPFHLSFDEMVICISDWVEAQTELLNE